MNNVMMIASKNPGKVKEFQHIFSPYGIEIRSLLDYPEVEDVVEDGETFEDNALIKAQAISEAFGVAVLADDSGLAVDALDGRPGVYSARYAGPQRSDHDNLEKVLAEMEDVPPGKRGARFVCALAICRPQASTLVVRGECEGEILRERRGNGGFGYDPIFYLPALHKTMAEIPQEEKNVLSHRAQAFAKLEALLDKEGIHL